MTQTKEGGAQWGDKYSVVRSNSTEFIESFKARQGEARQRLIWDLTYLEEEPSSLPSASVPPGDECRLGLLFSLPLPVPASPPLTATRFAVDFSLSIPLAVRFVCSGGLCRLGC